jgi:hypothetical protein
MSPIILLKEKSSNLWHSKFAVVNEVLKIVNRAFIAKENDIVNDQPKD